MSSLILSIIFEGIGASLVWDNVGWETWAKLHMLKHKYKIAVTVFWMLGTEIC